MLSSWMTLNKVARQQDADLYLSLQKYILQKLRHFSDNNVPLIYADFVD